MRLHIGTAAAALGVLAVTAPAQAQIASLPPAEGAAQGWSFAVTPYAWLPTISSSLQATGPRGEVVNSNLDAGIGDYLTDVNFAAMIGAAARYRRFTVMTDLIYLNASLGTDVSHLSTVNLGPGPIDIPRSQQLSTGTRAATTIWSLASGYTLLQGGWGNVDAVGGLRMLAVNSTTNYTLAADILAPNRTIALTRDGSLKVDKAYFNGIGGVTGRINIPKSRLYVPFYLDAGGGGVPFTWQPMRAWPTRPRAGPTSLPATGTSRSKAAIRVLRSLSLSGPILAANFHF